jgi:hypothetical protein
VNRIRTTKHREKCASDTCVYPVAAASGDVVTNR